MRTKLFTLGLAALSLLTVSCKKDNSLTPPSTGDAVINIAIKSAPASMRAYGTSAQEDKITKLTAIVYKGEAQEAIKTGEAGALKVEGIVCSAGARTLVVLANVPADWDLKGVKKSELKAKTFEMNAKHQTPEDLLMTSEFTDVTLKAGENHYGYATGTPSDNLMSEGKPLDLKRVHAGIDFVGVSQNFKDAYKDFEVKFEGGAVIALIAKKQSNIFGDPLANSDDAYLRGEDVPAGTYTPANYAVEASLTTAITDADIAALGTTPKGYYVLENTDAAHPTILCLKGKLMKKGGAELSEQEKKDAFAAGWIVSETDATTYYPVRVNATSNNYTYSGASVDRDKIVRNHKYHITLEITGPGTNKPEDPQDEKANLNVECQIVDWVVVNQNATW